MPQTPTNRAFVALGSNLQDPALQIKNAFLTLEKLPKTKLVKSSSLYQSDPVGYANQPDFINAVAEISTQLSPEDLLAALLNIERAAGRERPFANAPRVLDCDLLLYDDVVTHTEKLTLPHPRMHERSFVLLPLAEIAPDLVIPNRGSVVKLALAHQNQSIKKLNEHI
ncbi:MAG: 2-amino-4-hydroxy-6-hydroxymethyldihydropteridine diphosphokinase [Methylotenera sp.]